MSSLITTAFFQPLYRLNTRSIFDWRRGVDALGVASAVVGGWCVGVGISWAGIVSSLSFFQSVVFLEGVEGGKSSSVHW